MQGTFHQGTTDTRVGISSRPVLLRPCPAHQLAVLSEVGRTAGEAVPWVRNVLEEHQTRAVRAE